MVLNILERRFGSVMFIWVVCLVGISLGIKVSASEIGAANHSILHFFLTTIWYLTFLTVVLGVSKKYWLESLTKRRSN